MPRLENNGGDRLARGAVSHTFKPMGERLTRENWDKMFEDAEPPVVKAVYILNCPVHGEYESERECFVSGGFPLLDENLAAKCQIDRCGEITKYVGHKVTSGGDSNSEAGTAGVVSGEIACGDAGHVCTILCT